MLTLASLLLSDGVSFHFARGMSTQPMPSAPAPNTLALHADRSSPFDLELGGELAGLPPGATRYLTREDLLALPQISYTVTDDANFTGPTQISGVLLEELTRRLSAAPATDMVVAICGDLYHANYPKAYIAEHHPVLGAANELVQSGYRIAQQNCFRCHNMGNEGGTKAGRPWLVLSAWAAASPDYFAAYVRNPQSKNPQAQMRGNPDYDNKTIAALIAYFKTFSSSPQEQEKEKP